MLAGSNLGMAKCDYEEQPSFEIAKLSFNFIDFLSLTEDDESHKKPFLDPGFSTQLILGIKCPAEFDSHSAFRKPNDILLQVAATTILHVLAPQSS